MKGFFDLKIREAPKRGPSIRHYESYITLTNPGFETNLSLAKALSSVVEINNA